MKIFKTGLLIIGLGGFLFGCKTLTTDKSSGTKKEVATNQPTTAVPEAGPMAVKKDSAFAIVSVERTRKTVYRGLKNPLTIVVPGAISTKVEGSGLMKAGNYGHYILRPGAGDKAEIRITASMPDGSTFTESRYFIVKNLPNPKSYFAGETSLPTMPIALTEDQIIKGEVSLMMVDFDYDLNFVVTGFEIVFPSGKKITVSGDRFDSKALEMLKKVRHKGQIKIQNIKADSPDQNAAFFRADPILIKLNKKAHPKK